MSQAPYALRDARFGTKLGLDLKVRFLNSCYPRGYSGTCILSDPSTPWTCYNIIINQNFIKRVSLTYFIPQLEDTLWQGLTDFHIKLPMGITGENLAEKYNITRQDCDEFALLSQKRWAEGNIGKKD